MDRTVDGRFPRHAKLAIGPRDHSTVIDSPVADLGRDGRFDSCRIFRQ
jgi:hypothetical protein